MHSSPFSTSPTAMETSSTSQRRIRRSSSLELIHLDVPLISTRRPSNPARNPRSPELHKLDTSRRVPFLWERVPGVPKDGSRRPSSSSHNDEEFFFFPPKPPPGRSHPASPCVHDDNSEDDGNDGDVDSFINGDSEEERWASFAVEKDSLPYSAAMDCRQCKGIQRSPSFIMNRFLPAANAIAARSTPAIPKHPTRRSSPSTLSHRLQREIIKSQHRQQQQTTATKQASSNAITIPHAHQRHLPSKACGLQVFFPWTFKQTPCGHKSPVRRHAPASGGDISGKKSRRFTFDATTVKDKVEDNLSSKAFKSPGWALPFLDTSRLRLRRKDDEEKEKGRQFMEGMKGAGKPTWSLPRLQKPSEPWLSQALNKNANRRY